MIQIRELQHYLYCPHRWELLYKENMWQENAFTAVADLIHERVHSGSVLAQSKNKISLSDVSVYSQSLGIYGKADCIELKPSEKGVPVYGFSGKYLLSAVEYKPTAFKDKPFAAERLQLYAQTRCIEEVFSTFPEAYFYFADKKKRVPVQFNAEDEVLLVDIIEKIKVATESGILTPPEYGEKCNGCSLRDRCMPKCKKIDVKKEILGGMK